MECLQHQHSFIYLLPYLCLFLEYHLQQSSLICLHLDTLNLCINPIREIHQQNNQFCKTLKQHNIQKLYTYLGFHHFDCFPVLVYGFIILFVEAMGQPKLVMSKQVKECYLNMFAKCNKIFLNINLIHYTLLQTSSWRQVDNKRKDTFRQEVCRLVQVQLLVFLGILENLIMPVHSFLESKILQKFHWIANLMDSVNTTVSFIYM